MCKGPEVETCVKGCIQASVTEVKEQGGEVLRQVPLRALKATIKAWEFVL